MGSDNLKSESEKVLPEGFIFVNFNILLYVIGMSVIGGFMAGQAGVPGGIILMVFTFILCLAAVITRRKTRTFLKQNGKVEISFTFSPEPDNNVKKKVLFRDVADIIDDCVDNVLG